MRQIKFRAWDKSAKRFLSGHEPEEQPKREFIALQFNIGFSGWNREDIVLSQFTGLKDKNGKEIYEGDLLRTPPLSEWDKDNYACHEVFFHDGDANFDYNIGYTLGRTRYYGSVCGGCFPPFKPKQVSKLIIVGNIYEQ